MRYPKPLLLGLVALGLSVSSVSAQGPGAEISGAANAFLATLTPEQKTKAVYEFKNDERFDWHFIPKPRKGLPFKEMTPAQRLLAHGLLGSALSNRGYLKATTIMSLEQILFELENKSPNRDPELYYVTIFGEPGKAAWGWRVEGHHLSLNFTLDGDQIVSGTPSFLGTNPALVQSGPRKGLRVLAAEEDLGRQLVKSLSAGQLALALFSTNAPREIITNNDRKARLLEPVGIPATNLSAQQRELLLKLIREYVSRYRGEIAEADLKAIQEEGVDKLSFGWAGGTEPGQENYYRVQGPTFLLEYDNTQNGANHVHTVWRDLLNDFGDDVLRKHYDQVTHPK